MGTIANAFELKTGEAARSTRSRTKEYFEYAPEQMSQFWAKSHLESQALLGFGKDGA